MKRLSSLALFSLFLSFFHIHAQEQAYWDEHFEQNRRGWWTGANTVAEGRIANGKYYLKQLRPATFNPTAKVALDPGLDYTIEAEMTHLEGPGNHGYGIVWGKSDLANFNAFMICSDGSVAIYRMEKGVRTDYLPLVKHSAIEPKGKANILVIAKRADTIRCLLNGEEIYTGKAPALSGSNIGFISYSAMLRSDDIIASYSTVRLSVDRIIVRQDNPIHIVPDLPSPITKVNLGPNVNDDQFQLGPIVAPDGKTLYWCNMDHPSNVGGLKDGGDIMYSSLVDGKWTKAVNMGIPLNNDGPNWVVSISPDNNTLMLANRYGADGSHAGDGVSISYRDTSGWVVPVEQRIKNLNNQGPFYNFFLANDRKTLLMTVNRPGTFGGTDLFISKLEADGSWTEPLNAGPVINSYADEWSPFLAADGVTLYYSSEGKPGYGGADIFMTKRLDDTWQKWSEPLNLGPEINTLQDDKNLTLTASGEFSFLTSQSRSLGKDDIFSIVVPEPVRPKPVVMIYGKVLDSKTKTPLAAGIVYRELATDREVGFARSNPADGSYRIILPAGQVYSFLAEKESFYSISENFDVTSLDSYKEIEKNLFLTPAETGAVIRMNNIFFDFAKAELRPESYPELDRAVDFLVKNPGINILVSGHTDNVGNDANNRKLSEDRARAVAVYMVQKGIAQARIASKGFGKTKPLESNDSEEGRQFNRRVEFTILNK